ncbi:hypothetical protein [Geminisphaera colitermitum]|uniref:hypothetical protein n=1 Tax=Geminisphaera colitermitum TaxID=1148786 RepID=UPI000158C820|nr:hypothetical protein [Geminisphaera colitermitum]
MPWNPKNALTGDAILLSHEQVLQGAINKDQNALRVEMVKGGSASAEKSGRIAIPDGVMALAVAFPNPFAAGVLPVVSLTLETPVGGANIIGHIEALTNVGFNVLLTGGGGEGYFVHYRATV